MSSLADKVLSGTVQVNTIRLSQNEYDIFEHIIINRTVVDQVVPDQFNQMLNTIEQQIIGHSEEM